MEILVVIAIAALCAYMANHKGRNVYAWVFGGLFTGLVSPLVLLMRPHIEKIEKSDTWTCIGLHIAVIVGFVLLGFVLVGIACAGMIL